MLKYIEMAFEPFLLLCSAVLVIICLSKKDEEAFTTHEFASAMISLESLSAIISALEILVGMILGSV